MTRIITGTVAAIALAAAGDETGAPDWPDGEFHFVRTAYAGSGSGRYGRGGPMTDYPEAEIHFRLGVGRLTRVDIGEPRLFRPTDDALFDYPWLYAVEVGSWYLDDVEALRLREYLDRGGFLMVDDFHAIDEWERFMDSMTRVFPDRRWVEIPEDDDVFHVLYDLDQRIQVPGIQFVRSGRTYEGDETGRPPHWRGYYDDDGRLMVAINYNMDLGDAWEHADTPDYPEPMTALAYRFAVNYVIYAMTH